MMFRLFLVPFIFLLVGLVVQETNGQYYKKVGNKIFPFSTIVVDQSGNGHFSTIQSAIDSIPFYNTNWVAIRVKAGIYREKVVIPQNKSYIILKGAGKRKTIVEWYDPDGPERSPTFSILADNIHVRCMSFRNSYNNPINGNRKLRAVATTVSGDKVNFFRVAFYGYQDTLYDANGRHYYKLCTIQGAVDFIFGAGQSLFERCSISVIGGGFITAQGRESPNDTNGFVFKDCHIFGNANTYLGRPWRPYARVLFYKTNMTKIVEPSGWDSWSPDGREDLSTYAEYGNFGPGADTSKRVSWAKKLDLSTVENMANLNFINTPEEWINYQPF
ncbi:putative pectinesterase [Medicago truncatula]|uniref:Pectinesterase n=1 Tax=Medicago truncatula TaxID=3880 RepID=A0A396HD90_MEDTR|nr:probable pectinesterase 55 [Medicago truncatula]RHN51290.1 putative pectinesterase [Medicago truncatula]